MAGPIFILIVLNITEMSDTKKPAAKPAASSSNAPDENKELQKQLKELKRQNEEKDMKIMRLQTAPEAQPSNETLAVIEELQRQVAEIKNQSRAQRPVAADGKVSKYRPVLPEDIGDDPITFTARCIMKAIPGYMDENGVEIVAPHKMILMNYAASDIRMEGKEESILTFCSYTTKLKSEIEFLRNHPEYDITFGENMNEVAGHNPKEYQFKTKAAEQVAAMSPESVIDYAKALKIPNHHSKTNKQLKDLIVKHLVVEFKNEAESLQDKLKNRLLEQAAKVKG